MELWYSVTYANQFLNFINICWDISNWRYVKFVILTLCIAFIDKCELKMIHEWKMNFAFERDNRNNAFFRLIYFEFPLFNLIVLDKLPKKHILQHAKLYLSMYRDLIFTCIRVSPILCHFCWVSQPWIQSRDNPRIIWSIRDSIIHDYFSNPGFDLEIRCSFWTLDNP